MMVAANNGAGMNIGFPDVCLTPAAPSPIPVPYPNQASHATAVPFSPNIYFGFMPALNMSAKIPMTNGDNAGCANPLFMQMGQFTMGNPVVMVNCVPAVNLLVPTTGNMMNNAVGAQVVPNATTTLLTDAEAPAPGALAAEQLSALADAVRSAEDTVVATLHEGTARLTLGRFTADVTTLAFSALHRVGLDAIEHLEIDLRSNPGGDAEAALRLADDFVEPDTLLAIREEANGARYEHRARQSDPYAWPLTLVVDDKTASAAELFAGALAICGRATLVGSQTAGKATSQAVVSREHGAEYRTVCRWLLPNGESFADCGLEPTTAAADRTGLAAGPPCPTSTGR